MAGQRHGRFVTREVTLDPEANDREQRIRDALADGERRGWHLTKLSDRAEGRIAVLVWDAAKDHSR